MTPKSPGKSNRNISHGPCTHRKRKQLQCTTDRGSFEMLQNNIKHISHDSCDRPKEGKIYSRVTAEGINLKSENSPTSYRPPNESWKLVPYWWSVTSLGGGGGGSSALVTNYSSVAIALHSTIYHPGFLVIVGGDKSNFLTPPVDTQRGASCCEPSRMVEALRTRGYRLQKKEGTAER